MAKVMKDYPKLITCMAPSKTFNLAGLAFSNIIIRDPGLRARFKDRDKLFGMVNPMSLTAAKAAYLAWVDMSKCLPDVEDLPSFFATTPAFCWKAETPSLWAMRRAISG